jgi:PAS domain S-box-containing protein
MNQKWDGNDRRLSLRADAESLVISLSPLPETAQPAEILLHELLVHKVELEMQNEELRRTHNTLTEARDRYIELYDFAPVGYVTISREGLITEINLTGSTMLGVERTKLVNRRFAKFIAPEDSDRWYRLFMNIMTHAQCDKQEFGLMLKRAHGSIFHAQLDCLRRESSDAAPVLWVALTDITKLIAASEQI